MLVKDTLRQLARIVRVDYIQAIPKADRLEIAVVGGWKCVVSKGLYKAGDLALYFEIDAAVPINCGVFANFETKYLRIITDKQYQADYAIIKTLRLREVLSQGLLVHSNNYSDVLGKVTEGMNVTDKLGVLKYVSPEEASLYRVDGEGNSRELTGTRKLVWKLRAWLIKGIVCDGFLPFPTGIPKSDQERAQNMRADIEKMHALGHDVELTVKLDGESVTYYTDLTTGKIGVAQRNFALRIDDVPYTFKQSALVFAADVLRYVTRKLAGGRVTFPRWKKGYIAQSIPAVAMFYQYGIGEKIAKINAGLGPVLAGVPLATKAISLQGEAVGPDFNGNKEQFPYNDFFVYNVYADGIRVLPATARTITARLNMNYVPVISTQAKIPNSMEELLKMADGPGFYKKDLKREGIVGKNNRTGTSFKVISNAWLEKKTKKEVIE